METRLKVDIEKHLEGFHLQARLEVGTEVMVLFGPSGAGKTTTMNAIAGLLTPDGGEISLDGRVLFRRHRPGTAVNVPARGRRIGYVFQGYALFPHMTALENVAYPLRYVRHCMADETLSRPTGRRSPPGDGAGAGWHVGKGVISRAEELLERMHLAHLADRYPHELSGGQQQRVAIARALAADPQVLLLDEPFSALDASMRERLQIDLADLQAELGLAVIYVTHRLEDAFAMGHRLAVISQGRVEQVGPIAEVFRQPANASVAEIMGIRNLFRARVVEVTPERLLLDWDGLTLEAPPLPEQVGGHVTAYIRPEDIKVIYPDRPLMAAVSHNQVSGVIADSHTNASYRALRVFLPNGHQVEVRFPIYAYTPLHLLAGEEVRLSLRKEGLVILQSPL